MLRPQTTELPIALAVAMTMWGGDGVRQLTPGVYQSAPGGELIAVVAASSIPPLAIAAARFSCPTFSPVLVRARRNQVISVTAPRHSMLPTMWDEDVLQVAESLAPDEALLRAEVWTADTDADAAAMVLASPYIRSALLDLDYEVASEAALRSELERTEHPFLPAYDQAFAAGLQAMGKAA